MEIGDKVIVNDEYKEFDEKGKYTHAYCSGKKAKILGFKNETRGKMVYIELENNSLGKTNFKVPIVVLNAL